jgi:hypothetical protein
MKGNAKDYVSTGQQFFTACDAHDVDCKSRRRNDPHENTGNLW